MEYEYIGAIKIRDGLFLGDQFAAQDLEFVVTNKVTKIINCAGKQIPNHWESIGIAYLTFPWFDNETQVIFDQKDEVVNQCYKFIEDGLNQGESIIVHSVRGHNRSVCVLCLYFMKKFRWTLYKTLQYLHSRRPDLEIRANFFNQLLALESKFQKQGYGAKTYNWDEIFEDGDDKHEEIVLKNTYTNAQAQGVADFKDNDARQKLNVIRWIDIEGKSSKLVNLCVPPYDQIDFAKRPKPKISIKQSARSIVRQQQEGSRTQVNSNTQQAESPQVQNYSQQGGVRQNSIKDIKQASETKKPFKQPQNNLNQREEPIQMSLNQIANQQLQQKFIRPEESEENKLFNKTADVRFLNNQPSRSQPSMIKQKPFSQTLQTQKVNNFTNSNDQWFKPPKAKKQELPLNGQNRPSTAPNTVPKMNTIPQFRQNKHQAPSGDLIITPYKRQSSLGNRTDHNQLPQSQFKNPKQRGFSPQNVYSHNPYAQKSFKPWKK